MLMKAQQDSLGIEQGWQGKFIEAGRREVVGILHVFSDNVELGYGGKQPTFRSCSLPHEVFRSEYASYAR